MTVTPTRLPGLVAALSRTLERAANTLARAATATPIVIVLSACAAGLSVTLGTAVAFG